MAISPNNSGVQSLLASGGVPLSMDMREAAQAANGRGQRLVLHFASSGSADLQAQEARVLAALDACLLDDREMKQYRQNH